ncbi:MAG: DNA-directed RNA polymerase subunit A' [Candidatus Pacearchaeota archaeon]|nr:DNA-directed RNA polymerase subunit A' [Candidatus Pacearchaeota archaeon]
MTEVITKQVKEIKFTLFSPEEIKKFAAAKIITPELYDMDGYPVDGGLMDLRLGVITPGIKCRTCGGFMKECLGHFGYIELARPVLHIKFLPLIELCLKATCNECGRILLSEEDIKKRKIEKAKTAKKCPYCNAKQEKVKFEKPYYFYLGKRRLFPTEIRERLAKISDEDCKILGINPEACRPEWAVLTLLLVPPVTTRPSITLETGEKSEDDLTHKLSDIVRANQRLWENLNAGAAEVIIEDLWDLLQYHVTTFFDNTISNIPPARHRSGQILKTITERIKGKEGRIRHNLAGKRVNFSSRTVISPDPFIEINEVGVPPEVAKVLTVPERATTINLERLKEFIKRREYPQAISIVRPDGKRKRITEETREQIAEEIDIGYIIERSLCDGDIVLFNRHPSLHRMSLMGHFVKVLPGRTFRIHPAACFPYNADFDGDEMNIHAPQTEEARAEAKILLDLNNHLMSPKINVNVFGCIEDAITGIYLLSIAKGIRKEDALQLLAECGFIPEKIWKKEKVDGKEIISEIMPKINFEMQNKACKKKNCPYFKNCKRQECPNNAYLMIKEGKIISGSIDGKILGVEESNLIRELDRKVGRKETMSFLRTIFLLGVLYLTKRGISMALSDIETGKEVEKEIKKIVEEAHKKTEKIIQDYNNKTLEILPGKTLEETREIRVLQTLDDVRPKSSEIVEKSLKQDNPAYIMALCGSRGKITHITQMTNIVGQQALWAKRINFGYTNRTLSFFKENDFYPRARGFVYSSFLKGLDADEFFFTAMTGRDGLMDTALRTPRAGYLSRRLINALQDMRVEYDRTVRDSNYNIIQFEYGEDNIDISKEHLEDKEIAPGEAVGIITAQSIGEPSMQMTLNVFHFAGISEMQISVGLPRLIEIFDARKQPSTPSMEIYLEKEFNNEEGAKKIASKIKEVTLTDVAKEITVDFTNYKINVQLDKEKMRNYNLNAEKVIECLKEKNLKVVKKDTLLIIQRKEKEDYKALYKLKEKLKKTLISGIKNIKQVLPKKEGDDYIIFTAGSNLSEILKVKGIDKERTITNDIFEIASVLGIEAARNAIINEAMKVIEKQGISVSKKHVMLIADAMTSTGEIKGITRTGIISDKLSILARASFETPIKHFVNAAINGASDHLISVVENLIFNQPVPVGTGLPGLLVKITNQQALARR